MFLERDRSGESKNCTRRNLFGEESIVKAKVKSAIIKQFVERQVTIPAPQENQKYPYSEYWLKAVACILLSGRVKAKVNGYPNMTDVDRVCKQANFNQYIFEKGARFLVRSKVINSSDRYPYNDYREGKNYKSFWSHDLAKIQTVARGTLLDFVQEYTGHQIWKPTTVNNSGLIEFLILFFTSFRNRELPVNMVGKIFLEFSKLPEEAFLPLMDSIGTSKSIYEHDQWKLWLDTKGQEALISAIYSTAWAYTTEHDGADWIYLNHTGQVMLGLESPPPLPQRYTEFKALPNLCVFAGSDLLPEILIPLFRHCKIMRIDRIFEFQFDKKAMSEVPSATSAGEELLKALQELEPLPSTIIGFLEGQSQLKMEGLLRMLYCSAIIKPENPELLSVIRSHPKLKGYIEPRSPKGYLLIKDNASAVNFIRRCEEYGFKVEPL